MDAQEKRNRIWALREAATRKGLTPHAASTAGFLTSLETEGLLISNTSHGMTIWYATDRGRAELAKLEAARADITTASDSDKC